MPPIILLSIILFINQFSYSSLYLFYEIKTIEEKNTIESLLSFNTTYTDLEIGTPPQKVKFFFTLNNHQYTLINDKNCSSINSFYPKHSLSFKGPFQIEPHNNNNYNQYIYTDKVNTINGTISSFHNIELKEFPFFVLHKINISETTYLCGYIGLAVMQIEIYKAEDKIVRDIYENLEKFGVKRHDDFTFFSKDGKDYLILGAQLQNIFPELLKGIKSPEWIHPSMKKNSFDIFWAISMKEVYYDKAHSDRNKFITFEINPLFELIIGTNEYKVNIIKDYFKDYINKGKCSIGNYINYNFQIISCESKNFNINDIKKFPNLYSSNLPLHYTFELKGEDLFIKINNKWYFGILFPIKDLDPLRWVMGRIFLRKYPIAFSPFNRLIGFYINKEIKNEKEMKEAKEEKKIIDTINKKDNYFKKDIFGYIKIIIIAFIFTIVGIIIGKKIFFMRKKRANELVDDSYQYDTEKKDTNNDNLNNTNIEMNSKLVIK